MKSTPLPDILVTRMVFLRSQGGGSPPPPPPQKTRVYCCVNIEGIRYLIMLLKQDLQYRSILWVSQRVFRHFNVISLLRYITSIHSSKEDLPLQMDPPRMASSKSRDQNQTWIVIGRMQCRM